MKYDIKNSSNATFFTYSAFWIRREMIKFMKDNRSIIRIPYNTKKSKYEFTDYNAWEPTMSLSIGDDNTMDQETQIDYGIFVDYLRRYLNEKDFQIVDLKYGLTCPTQEELTYKQVADLL